MSSNSERKNDKKNIIIIILLFIIVGLITYIIYDKILIKKKIETKEIDEKEVIKKDKVDLNVIYQVGDSLNILDEVFNDSYSIYFGYLYNKPKIDIENIESDVGIYTALYENMKNERDEKVIKEEIVKEKIKKIFGNNFKYEAKDVNAGKTYQIKYDASSKEYRYENPTVRGIYFPEFYVENVATYVLDKKIEVVRKIFYSEYDRLEGKSDITKVVIYKNLDKKEKLGEIKLNDKGFKSKEVFNKYDKKLDKYKFIFTRDDDNNYYFSSVEKIED